MHVNQFEDKDPNSDPRREIFLSTEELAGRWGVRPRTLELRRSRGQGPSYVKCGGAVRYRMTDVVAYEARRTFEPEV